MNKDLEIAQSCEMKPIHEIAKKIGLTEDEYEVYGKYKAKIELQALKDSNNGKLILVTAINPTKAGEGKSTTTIGLGDALQKLNKKAIVTLREPSLGPVFGLKGGAAGGGYAQAVPMEDLNLHFTGDIHAITTANNLISACIDNHIYYGNEKRIDCNRIVWKRCMDMSDRALRDIEVHIKKGKEEPIVIKNGFCISVASEVMAVLCLSESLADLKRRLAKMLVAYDVDGKPIYVKDFNIVGALTVILKDAIKPNLIQTLEHTPVIVHGGPFANIAHGCNSIIATKMALQYGDYVVTEAGFGADLGAEKFLDIKCRYANIKPHAVVIVATIKALKMHGGVSYEKLHLENKEALLKGCCNLQRHIQSMKNFNLPYVVAINQYTNDSIEELQALQNWCYEHDYPFSVSNVWKQGSEGAIDLANQVIKLCEQKNNFHPIYDLEDSIENKILSIVQKCYGGVGVVFEEKAREDLEICKKFGWDKLAICMAKTPSSLTDQDAVYGDVKDFEIHVREIRVSLGAGFLVVITGNILTMPGLPKCPAAQQIDIKEDGTTVGLF